MNDISKIWVSKISKSSEKAKSEFFHCHPFVELYNKPT